MTTETRTSVMLVDDHSIMRDLLRDALENTGEFHVRGAGSRQDRRPSAS